MGWVPPESDSETRIQEQVVYLGADPRDVYVVVWKRDREGKEANKIGVTKAVLTLGNRTLTLREIV